MIADSGTSSHIIDNQLLHGIEQKMINCVHLNPPPVTMNVAGHQRIFGVGKGVLVANVVDHEGSRHPVRLPVTILPGLGRHLFSGGTAAAKGVNMVIENRSYLDLGDFRVSTTQKTTIVPRWIISTSLQQQKAKHQRQPFQQFQGTIHARDRSGIATGTCQQVLQLVRRNLNSGVHSTDSFSACHTCKINKSTEQNHPRISRPDETSERLKLVSTDLLGPVTPKPVGDYSYMVKYTDHHTRLMAVYFVEMKSDTLHTL